MYGRRSSQPADKAAGPAKYRGCRVQPLASRQPAFEAAAAGGWSQAASSCAVATAALTADAHAAVERGQRREVLAAAWNLQVGVEKQG